MIRARKVVDGKPVDVIDGPKPKLVERAAALIVSAIDRADAAGAGCAGCRKTRAVLRKRVMRMLKPKR